MTKHIDEHIQFPRDLKDQTAAFQEALIHLRADGGGKLLLGPRQYNLGQVNLCSDLIIEGEGHATRLRKLDGHGRHMLFGDRVSNVTIRDLVLDGNEANQESGVGGKSCLRITDGSNIKVQDCWLYNGGNRNVDIRRSECVTFIGNRGLHNGIANPDGNGGATLHVDRSGNDEDSHSEDVIVIGNHLGHGGDSLIGLPSTHRAAVVGNILRGARSYESDPTNTEAGVSLVSNQDSVCVGNVFHKIDLAGSYRDRTYAPVENIVIVGNAHRAARWKCDLGLDENGEDRGSRAILVGCNSFIDGGQLESGGDGGSHLCYSFNLFNIKEPQQSHIKISGQGPQFMTVVDNCFCGEYTRKPIDVQKHVPNPKTIEGNTYYGP